jgi:anti-sigma factor RsiW
MTGQDHLDAATLARYIDGAADAKDRAGAESHLAECAECREEMAAVRRILQSSARRRWVPGVSMAMAAAAVMLIVVSANDHRLAGPATTRDPALTPALAPRLLAPLGTVARADSLQWTSVTNAHRYQVTVFSGTGTPVWQMISTDTAVALPDSLRLVPNTQYYWRLKAETEYGRWVESDLATFTLAGTSTR